MNGPETTFTCPRCSATSHNPNDVRYGYCGACHWWTATWATHPPSGPSPRTATEPNAEPLPTAANQTRGGARSTSSPAANGGRK